MSEGKRKSDIAIDDQSKALLDEIEEYQNQENVEKVIHNLVRSKLDEFLPRLLPGRADIMDQAADSAVAQFRTGVLWAIKHAPQLDTGESKG